MATDLAEILSDLSAEASTSSSGDTVAVLDARIALSRLRPALDRLHDDGLDTGASTDSDPDAFTRQAERVHWVRLLANTCARLGDATPSSETPGPMTRLADAAAVTAVLHADVLTGGQRWAIVAGLARTANHLVTAAGGGDQQSPDVDRALIITEASSGVLFQFAALDPPAAVDYAALHRPVPDPSARPTSVEAAALEASAALVHATRPGTEPHPIADILAVATAATTTCRFVAATNPGDDGVAALGRDAARAWVEVREQLAPFNDSSRRSQPVRPPAVESALALHRSLQSTAWVSVAASQEVVPDARLGAGVGVLVGRLAAVAERMDASVADGVARGRFMAYAVDVAMRDDRVRPFLQGRRGTGLVTVDADDVAPVRSALLRAGTATAALASSVAAPSNHADVHRGRTGRPERQPVPREQPLPVPCRVGAPHEAPASLRDHAGRISDGSVSRRR